MKIRSLIVVLVLPFLICACSKDGDKLIVNPEPSKTQVIADALQKEINKMHPVTARVYIYNPLDNSWTNRETWEGCTVNDPFVQVGYVNYHLKYLVRYQASSSLDLYFKY